jgi:hypothetical protein
MIHGENEYGSQEGRTPDPEFKVGDEVLVCGKTAGDVIERTQLHNRKWYYSVQFHNTGQIATGVIEEHMEATECQPS